MQNKENEMTVHLDGYTRVCLTVIAVLLTIVVLGLWADSGRYVDQAGAAVERDDAGIFKVARAGKQFDELIKVGERTNARLDEIVKLLQTGKIKVQVVGGVEKANGGSNVKPAQQN